MSGKDDNRVLTGLVTVKRRRYQALFPLRSPLSSFRSPLSLLSGSQASEGAK